MAISSIGASFGGEKIFYTEDTCYQGGPDLVVNYMVLVIHLNFAIVHHQFFPVACDLFVVDTGPYYNAALALANCPE